MNLNTVRLNNIHVMAQVLFQETSIQYIARIRVGGEKCCSYTEILKRVNHSQLHTNT